MKKNKIFIIIGLVFILIIFIIIVILKINKEVLNIDNTKDEILVYRVSKDILFDGDKIDLENRTIINNTAYNDDPNAYYKLQKRTPNITTMTGTYSNSIDDVLTIDGKPNYIYLKHILDKNKIIQKTEICILKNNKSFCQSYSATYDDNDEFWKNLKYDDQKQELANYYGFTLEETKTTQNASCEVALSEFDKHQYEYINCNNEFTINSLGNITVKNEQVKCDVEFSASICNTITSEKIN